LLGTGVLVAFAITGVQRAAPPLAGLAIAGWLGVSVYMATDALRYARRIEASVRTVVGATRAIEELPADSAAIAVCDLPSVNWQRLVRSVAMYAAAEHAPVPPTRDISCDDALGMLGHEHPTPLLVVISTGRQALPTPARAIVNTALRFDWRRFGLVTDTLRTDVFAPVGRNPGRPR
jgi:hypothetical protein